MFVSGQHTQVETLTPQADSAWRWEAMGHEGATCINGISAQIRDLREPLHTQSTDAMSHLISSSFTELKWYLTLYAHDKDKLESFQNLDFTPLNYYCTPFDFSRFMYSCFDF